MYQHLNKSFNVSGEIAFLNDWNKDYLSIKPFADHLGEKDIHFREV